MLEVAEKKQTLWDIGEDLLALERLVEECDGDISDPAVDAAITAWMDEMAKNQAVKCDGYVGLIRKWEMQKSAAVAEAEQYRKIASVRGNRIERLKVRLMEHMQATGQTKIETATGRTIGIQKNGGKVPLVVAPDVDPTQIDSRYQAVSIELDNEAVRKALEGGEKLAFASLGDRGVSLRIR
jgi:hypothetical protein